MYVYKKNHVNANCFDVNSFHIYMAVGIYMVVGVFRVNDLNVLMSTHSTFIYMVVGVFRINELNDGCIFLGVMAYLGVPKKISN